MIISTLVSISVAPVLVAEEGFGLVALLAVAYFFFSAAFAFFFSAIFSALFSSAFFRSLARLCCSAARFFSAFSFLARSFYCLLR